MGRGSLNQMASYFVQIREHERRLLRAALAESDGDVIAAAALLGIHELYFKVRAKLLGAVLGKEPKHEPPGTAQQAWNDVSNEQLRRRARQQIAARTDPGDAREPVDKTEDDAQVGEPTEPKEASRA